MTANLTTEERLWQFLAHQVSLNGIQAKDLTEELAMEFLEQLSGLQILESGELITVLSHSADNDSEGDVPPEYKQTMRRHDCSYENSSKILELTHKLKNMDECVAIVEQQITFMEFENNENLH